MKDIKLNINITLLVIIGIVIGSRLEILMQQNSWTPAICVAQVLDADELVVANFDDGNSKTIKPNGKINAVAVK
jgi:cytosine/uracil/thiamine/allantoin permease